ncbi:MAG TPA: hypothetical protein DCP91_08605 [Eggerthellaceae bacterium]|nr:hypothetical protein [Eggerthellaceae bacterium]
MRCYGQVEGRAHRAAQPEARVRCPGCGRKRPQGEFEEGGKRSRWCGRCRAVKAAEEARRAEEERRALNMPAEDERRCPICKKAKHVDEFRGHGGRETKTCRACRAAALERKRRKAR